MLARWVLMPVRVDRASIEGLGHVMDTVLAHRMAARPLGVVLTMVPVRATRIAAALAGDYAAVWAEAQHRMGNGA